MQISSAHDKHFAISRELELIDEVDNPIAIEQQVEVGGIFQGEDISFFVFKI